VATVIEVNQFLRRFKAQVNNHGLEFVPRKVNLDALAQFGLSIADARAIILSLIYMNYSEGPESDMDGSAGEVWIFGAEISGKNVYIKLKLDNGEAKCLSFHQAEHSIRKPYNLGGK
jgi:hypothetical protein